MMLKKQLRRFALRAVRKHPRRALKVLLFAGKHRKVIATAVKLARRSSRLTGAVKQTAPNVPVAGFAGRRGRRGSATESAEQLRAEPAAKQRQTRRRIVRATVITAGAGALGRAGYAGWKKARGSSAQS